MGKKKKQKKKPIEWRDLAINALIDLIIGIILIIIGKYIGQGESPNLQAGNKPAAYKKYITNPKPSKEYDFEIRYFFSSCRTGKVAYSFCLKSKGKERHCMNLGENIRNARKAAGVSQKELAERLQVHQKDISRWENGAHAPTIEIFIRICRELNASADEILELR